MKIIDINDMLDFQIGSVQDENACTGVTVVIAKNGAKGGVDISGGGPATRETPLLMPLTADNPINAVVLSGGSAFGLAACDGVMRYLEERDIGYQTGYAKVPLVAQACIYDLGVGSSKIRPDAPWLCRMRCIRKKGSKFPVLWRRLWRQRRKDSQAWKMRNARAWRICASAWRIGNGRCCKRKCVRRCI